MAKMHTNVVKDAKIIGTASKTPLNSRGVFISNLKPSRPISDDPHEILRRLIVTDGCVKKVGEICERNPQTAEWLLRKIQEVDELRVRDGKASGRFDAYADAARQGLARAECRALLVKIANGEN